MAWGQALERISRREEEDQAIISRVLGPDADSQSKIYCYSGQALSFKERAASELRKQLSTTKNATFTYSGDFLSQVSSVFLC